MKKIFKKYQLIHILNLLLFSLIVIAIILLHHTITIPILLLIFICISIFDMFLEYCIITQHQKELLFKEKIEIDKTEQQFQESLKHVYDEHIFSITHELRSPLSVITASIHNQYNTLKMIYNNLSEYQKKDMEIAFSHSKKALKTIKTQTEIIESFISSIAEYGSYMSTKGQKIINLHNYLLSIIINSKSYSRNMKVFSDNNIKFSDNSGLDFSNINCVVSPHDLSRMLTNIMTNSADAVSSCYKKNKESNYNYEPYIKFSCIRPKNKINKMILSEEFLRINCNSSNDSSQFYLIIEDNGPGISKENITKIFKYGFSTKKDDESNSLSHYGLGLHLTLNLAALNDINVFIRTNKYGTMFVLGFPFVIYDDNIPELSKESESLYNMYIINEVENKTYENNLLTYNKMKLESPPKTKDDSRF